MQKYKIVFQGKTKKGSEIVIRYPVIEDAENLMNFINELSQEKTFILKQGEQMDLKGEKKFLIDMIKKINKKQAIMLLVVNNNTIIGNCRVDLQEKVHSHVGNLGISIAKDFRGEGLGKLLMRITLKKAKKNFLSLKIITLGVFANNAIAQTMYKQMGFIEYGRLPQAIMHRGQYIDHILFYKNVET